MSIADLIAAHAPGYALSRDFYVRGDIFERDMDLLLGRWTCVGHVSEVAAPGDYLVAELGLESAVVVRGEDGQLRALNNVCRHRGSRICAPGRGSVTLLTCPYHAWSYRLDGRLRAAREMPEGFDPARYALRPLPIAVIGGLILVSFSGEPPGLDAVEAALGSMTARYGWESARIAHKKTYQVAANWKLVMENYHECYHCAVAHPEFSAHHALARPKGRALRSDRDIEVWGAAANGREVARLMASALAAGSRTGSADGKLVAPLMDKREGDAGGCLFAEAGFLSAFLAYADHGVIYRFIPRAPLESEMEVIWLVRGDAVEGRDYDLGRLTWLWDVTSMADKRIIEMNQAGVRSRAYEPGPYSLMEPGTRAYTDRYLSELAATCLTTP
ncbi:MAG: aromatic ring-hydroxylating dioxygenase subunit alpha [Pseudomonadota bacterium]|nr:aromatic ring-hydroxylating dioxygenase subunit alpha [Pseudomonadota bacterium]